MDLETMSKDEKSLLLFLEDGAVNNSGRVNGAHMSATDYAIAEKWNESGFVEFGRIVLQDAMDGANGGSGGANWCKLSDEAFALAHEERKRRAQRCWEKRSFHTTREASSRI